VNTIQGITDTVIHNDCVRALRLFPSQSVDLVVTDPPYLVRYKPRDGRKCVGDNSSEWLQPAFREIYRVLKANSFCATFYGWPWVDRFMSTWKQCGFRPVSHLTWIKKHCSREGYTESFHEVGFLLAKGTPRLPKSPIRDVLDWEYTGNQLHTNQKPLCAILPLIECYSDEGDIVLDPFAGSGTTAVAAKMLNRRFILIEKVYRHCETARRRLKERSPTGVIRPTSSEKVNRNNLLRQEDGTLGISYEREK
jgi:DNA modification methylase